jgi:VWFA-related protein
MALALLPPLQAQAPSTAFTDSVDVSLVNVEAVVTDHNGVRVFGLTPDDFRLLVDGEEVPIEFFTEYRGGEALRDIGASPWDIAPISERQARGTSYLVFVDDFFTIASDRNRVLRALESQLAFLEREDRLAVVAWDGSRLEMLSTWSTSHRQLKKALRQAAERPAGGLRRFAERRSLLSGTVPTQRRSVLGGRPLAITERIYVERLTDEIKEAVGAASATLRGFAAPPGRKVMLLVSGGWPLAPADFVTGDPVTAQLDRHFERGAEIYGPVIETANLLGYTLYPIDAPGMQAGSGVSAAEATSRASIGPRSLDFYRELELHDSLRYLARETGGRALINGQREEPLSRVVADTQSFYWMGFTPQRTGDGEIRKIQIEMRSPGLEVRSRTGYRDLSITEEITMQVESTLLFGSPARTDQLVVEIGASQELKRKRMLVPLTVRLPASAVALLPAGEDRFSAELEVHIAAIDDKGDRSAVTTLPWRVTRSRQPESDESLQYATTLQLRLRSQDLVVAVYDTRTGELFSSSIQVSPVT